MFSNYSNALNKTTTVFLAVSLLIIRTSTIVNCESFLNATYPRSNTIDRRKTIEDYDSSESTTPLVKCISCMREEIKTRNIEVIKDEVLKKLGFTNPPNTTGKIVPQVPSQILSLVEADSDWPSDQPDNFYSEEDDDFHVKTEKVIVFAQTYRRLRHWKGHEILHFTFSNSTAKYHVANATLYMFIKGTNRRPVPIITIEVFKVFKTDVSGTVKMISKKITQPYGEGEWYRFDMSVMVSEWLKRPEDNLGFIINGTVEGKKFVIMDKSNEPERKVPYVEISTKPSKRKLRRNLMNCDEGSNERICCRYPLMIDFESFGWDFIIAPKKYNAHYCAGDCDPMTLQRYPHTHIANMAAPHMATPCCAPRKLSSISMLYFDDELNFVYGSLPSMVVDRCGCS